MNKIFSYETKVYTIRGRHDSLDEEGYPLLLNKVEKNKFLYAEEEKFACAKEYNGEFFIKVNSVNNLLFDPTNNNYKLLESQVNPSKKMFEYKKVSETVFKSYLKFLKNYDLIAFNYAERLYRNG